MKNNKAKNLAASCCAGGQKTAAFDMGADEAYIKHDGKRWVLGTATAERTIALEDGKLFLKSFKNRVSGREMVPEGVVSEEFSVAPGKDAPRLTGLSGSWKLVGAKETKLKQGERQLDITVQRDSLQVTKSYVIYPGSSIAREWATFKNAGKESLQIVDPGFLNFTARTGDPSSLDFLWMSGGINLPGSWDLKTETLSRENPRTFDSNESFPFKSEADKYPGGGVNAKILLNDKQIWPATEGWQYVKNALVKVPFDVNVAVKEGDRLIFLVNTNKGPTSRYHLTAFDPTISCEHGESHTASKEFSQEQGKNGWRYQYRKNGDFKDLVYFPGPDHTWKQRGWWKESGTDNGTISVQTASQQPGNDDEASARVWTASKAGQVRVTGSVCNTGNNATDTRCGFPGHRFCPGSSSYAPWNALYNKDTKDGLFIGWDYFGHWISSFALGEDGGVTAQLKVAGHKQTLAPGESVATPKAFTGLFRDDLDNAGNECLDWQYRYLWDYTREGWFPAIRMCGFWVEGTNYPAGPADMPSLFRKVFSVVDLMRDVGGDVYHRDAGWWDCAGDWNGPDFRATGDYLRKYGMGQLIYAWLYVVNRKSRVAREHPDWFADNENAANEPDYVLDMSKPEVVEFIKGQLDMFAERWGNFEWRNDSIFTFPRNGDETFLLAQDAGLRRVLRDFLDKHPACAFQAVNNGGHYGGYDYTRYCSSFSFSDGAVGILRNYYASLLFPPDKTSDIPDAWRPDKYDKATWRGLLCFNFDMTGDTWDPAKREGVRQLIDIYHYLYSKGVVGRWVKVYRPGIIGDDPTMYFQRLSKDGMRGLIIPKRNAPRPVTIKPKGLLPNATYFVSFQESPTTEKRQGADLMENGIRLGKMIPGELIYLNLPLHPGSNLDTEPPSPPGKISKQAGENMGYPGVELSWKPGADNNWVSCYEIFRNGLPLGKVAKGTFYFDHSAGADLAAKYEVRTVDGAGNVSTKSATKDCGKKPALVFDDAPGQGLVYSGEWKHSTNQLPAHAGTISCSNHKGAAAELVFEGKTVLLFAKLGANCGKAAVSIDGAAPEVVDTYSADDIWGVCVWSKKIAAAGRHTLRIEVLGEQFVHPTVKNPDTIVHIDGARVESE